MNILLSLLQIFRAKELLDNTLAFIKIVMSGAIIDPDRLVIGTEEGLFCLDLDRNGKLSIYFRIFIGSISNDYIFEVYKYI